MGDVVLTIAGTVLTLSLVRNTERTTSDPAPARARFKGGEMGVVLGGFVVLFALFTTAQIAAAVGGDSYVRRRTGGNYTDYARAGFFQLLGASAITLFLLMCARGSVRRSSGAARMWLRVLSCTLCGLSIAVVASSFRRIQLYSSALGYTMLRLYSATFALWLALVFVLVVGAVLSKSEREWLGAAVLTTALAGLLLMNLMNPEAIVVNHNISRARRIGVLDDRYFAQLSPDGWHAIAGRLNTFASDAAGRDMRSKLVAVVCEHQLSPHDGGLAYNASHRRARLALHRACPTAAS